MSEENFNKRVETICEEMYLNDEEFKSYVDLIKNTAHLRQLSILCARNFEEFFHTNPHIKTYLETFNSDDISSIFNSSIIRPPY